MFNRLDNIFGYFGKLPGFNDFVKFNAGGEELLVFDKWLQEGIISARMKLKSNWTNYYKNSEQYFFFYPFTGTGRALAGLIIPGYDKSGREFPFIVFFYFDKERLNNFPSHLIPMILFDILKEFKFAVIDIFSITDLSIINERLNKISYNLNNIYNKKSFYQNYISNTQQAVFWKRIIPVSNDSEKLLFLENLYSSDNKHKAAPVIISFISGEDHYLNDLTFLLHITITFRNLPDSLPAIFWSYSENKNHFLYLFLNKPLPNNYIDLLSNQIDETNLQNEKQNNPNENIFGTILNKDLSLKELLKSF